MKNFLVIISIAICIASCSKDSANEEQPQQPVELSVTIKDGFTGAYGEEIIPYKNLRNIVVGDEIPYTLTIDETSNSDANVKYVLTPITKEDKNHQTRVDYDFYLENANGEKVRVTEPYIEFHKIGTYKFYIKPLVSGTFKLPFILQKMSNGEELKKIELPTLNFNAVRIELKRFLFYIESIRINGERKPYAIYYELKMEDGVNETDIYLSPPGKEWNKTFIVRCNRFKYEGAFEEGKVLSFKDEEERQRCHSASITIVQQKEGQEEFRVTYYNVPIENTDKWID
ncbi:hypothetical protein [Capnocytophaga sputigena]|uniref:hypothetical protein n=1 Tax=Capnocytophaga sputigena TaxID=1019 RepID=UPI0028E70689|nr:hypothetical protein [Capnocytophaga sputigena]